MKTHYEVLGVGQGAPLEEIKSAYKARIREVHPDVFQGAAEEATERAIELNGAYAVLSDPEKRALYDRMLFSPAQAQLQQKPPSPPPQDPMRYWNEWVAQGDKWLGPDPEFAKETQKHQVGPDVDDDSSLRGTGAVILFVLGVIYVLGRFVFLALKQFFGS